MMLNPTAVDPVYRIHASRLKLLYTQGKQNLEAIQVCLDVSDQFFESYFFLEKLILKRATSLSGFQSTLV